MRNQNHMDLTCVSYSSNSRGTGQSVLFLFIFSFFFSRHTGKTIIQQLFRARTFFFTEQPPPEMNVCLVWNERSALVQAIRAICQHFVHRRWHFQQTVLDHRFSRRKKWAENPGYITQQLPFWRLDLHGNERILFMLVSPNTQICPQHFFNICF